MSTTDERPEHLPQPHPVDPEGNPSVEPEGDLVAGGWMRIAAVAGFVAVLGILGGLPLLVVVLAVVFMIFMHELGHYITAKRAGMKVTEFFIGFGPRIWSFQKGETEYGLKAIPAGAYVKIIGMNNLDEVPPEDEGRTYRQKPYWRRMSVAVAGSTMHFLMALVLIYVLLVAFGRANPEAWTVTELSTGETVAEAFDASIPENQELIDAFEAGQSPADEAGIQLGDRIVEIDGQQITEFPDVRDAIVDHPGDELSLVIVRDGEQIESTITPGTVSDGEATAGFLGVASEIPDERVGPIAAIPATFEMFGEIVVQSVQGIADFFTPSGLSNFFDTVGESTSAESTPEPTLPTSTANAPANEDEGRIISIVGAIRIGAQGAEQSFAFLFGFMALLNIFIGVFNLIPLLPFDGGHVAVGTYEKIRELLSGQRRYMADVSKLLPLTYVVVFTMIALGSMALYADVLNPVDLQ
jgi:membrane-associated protease RseP (regulator of RpoE activity)